MKKLFCLALVAIMALSCAVLPAMADSHPLIYKVTDAEGHYLYLLGTMHVTSQDTFPIAKLDEVMGQVDHVLFEMDEANMEKIASGTLENASSAEAAAQMFVTDNGLSDPGAQLIAEFLSEIMHTPVEAATLKVLPLPLLAQLVQTQTMAALGYDATGRSVDAYLFGEAKKRNLKISGVETPEEQMKAMEAETAAIGQNPAMVEKTIAEMIGNLEKVKQELDGVVKAYNTGDKEALIRCFTAEAARSSVDGSRNARFLEAAQKALKDGGRTLIAIGEYHIIAEDGLVNALTQAGCTVTLVK